MSTAEVPRIALGDLLLGETAGACPDPGARCGLYTLRAFASGEPEHVAGADIPGDARRVRAQDVLMSVSLRHPRRAWVVGTDPGRESWATRDWIPLRSAQHDANFLRHVLVSNTFLRRFELAVRQRRARGLRERLAGLDIPLQSLAEQRRVVQILDLAHALRMWRQAMAPLLDELTRALHLERAGDDERVSGQRLAAMAPLCASAQRSSLALDELVGTLRDLAFLGRLVCA